MTLNFKPTVFECFRLQRFHLQLFSSKNASLLGFRVTRRLQPGKDKVAAARPSRSN